MAIIAVLLAILLPLLSMANKAARRTACLSNMRQVGQLLFAYTADNKGELPPFYGGETDAPLRPQARTTAVVDPRAPGGITLLIAPPIGQAKQAYTPNARVFFCPSDSVIAPHRRDPDGFSDGTQWNDPAHPSPFLLAGYVYHYVPPGGDFFQGPNGNGTPRQGWHKGLFAGLERHKVGQRNAAALSILSELMERNEPNNFHATAGNVLFLDGHVKRIAWRTSSTPRTTRAGTNSSRSTALRPSERRRARTSDGRRRRFFFRLRARPSD